MKIRIACRISDRFVRFFKQKSDKGEVVMAIINMDLPDEMIQYVVPKDKEAQLIRNAMMLYPYIQNGTISHGKAAEILGVFKMDLITLYGKMGLSYIEMTDDEIEEELETVNYLKEVLI